MQTLVLQGWKTSLRCYQEYVNDHASGTHSTTGTTASLPASSAASSIAESSPSFPPVASLIFKLKTTGPVTEETCTLPELAPRLFSIEEEQSTTALQVQSPHLQYGVAKAMVRLVLGDGSQGFDLVNGPGFVLPLIMSTEEWDQERYSGDWRHWVNQTCAKDRKWVPKGYLALNPLWKPVLLLVHSSKKTKGAGLKWTNIFNSARNKQGLSHLVVITDAKDIVDMCPRVYQLENDTPAPAPLPPPSPLNPILKKIETYLRQEEETIQALQSKFPMYIPLQCHALPGSHLPPRDLATTVQAFLDAKDSRSLLLSGDSGAGKSTFLERLCYGEGGLSST